MARLDFLADLLKKRQGGVPDIATSGAAGEGARALPDLLARVDGASNFREDNPLTDKLPPVFSVTPDDAPPPAAVRAPADPSLPVIAPVTRDRVVDTEIAPELPSVVEPATVVAAPALASARTQSRIGEIQNKDYSRKVLPDGTIVRGANRDKDYNWKDVLEGLGLGILKGWGKTGSIFGGIGEGIKGATDRNYGEKYKDEREVGALTQTQAQQIAAEKTDRDARLQEAQIATIPIDDANKRLQIKTQQEIAAERQAGAALTRVVALKYFDPQNPAHKRLATQARLDPETLKGWDDRDPKTKQVAGVTYQFDYATRSFVPSNVPVEESKTAVDYKVTMPNGEVRTYKVTQAQAANFSTQMSALGARLEQQESQFTRTQAQRDKEFQANYGLAKQRITQAAQNYKLALDKFNEAKARGEKVDEMQIKRLQLALTKTRADINGDLIMSDKEKAGLLSELPVFDEK